MGRYKADNEIRLQKNCETVSHTASKTDTIPLRHRLLLRSIYSTSRGPISVHGTAVSLSALLLLVLWQFSSTFLYKLML